MRQSSAPRARLWQLDALRGLALINMLAYHAMYDWVYLFGHESSWYSIWSPGCHAWQQYICWSFILLSGLSFSLSRRPLKNGLLVSACAAVLTLVTVTVMPEESIWFGVLHLLGSAVLITCLLRSLLEKIPAGAGMALSALLFFLTNQVPYGALGFESLRLAELPAALYARNWYILGFPDLSVFSSADYFPLIPWLFLYWMGYFFGKKFLPALRRYAGTPPALLRPLCALGSHTLPIYMIHQPVIYGGLWLVSLI